MGCLGVRTNQARKKIRQILVQKGGQCPFRGPDAPFAPRSNVGDSEFDVKWVDSGVALRFFFNRDLRNLRSAAVEVCREEVA